MSAQARAGLYGTVAGLAVFGTLAWATTLALAIGVAGLAMIGLGLGMVARWPEIRFTPVNAGQRVAASLVILRRGIRVARTDTEIAAMLTATFLVNGAAEGFGRLYELRLLSLGLPTKPDPVVWLAVVAVLAAAAGALALHVVESCIDGRGVARRVYVEACGLGTVGLVMFAHAPNAGVAVAGALLVTGISFPIIRVVATIVVNRRTASHTRATVHSLLSQAENLGEILLGLMIAAVATGSSVIALTTSALLLASAGVVVGRRTRSSQIR